MRNVRVWTALFAGMLLAALFVACGGDEAAAPVATETSPAAEEARVQVIRGRASLGSADTPIVIEEYSDFL